MRSTTRYLFWRSWRTVISSEYPGHGKRGQSPRVVRRADHQWNTSQQIGIIELVAAGLDKLWVSLDGATPESYTDVRLGAALPEVLNNLYEFRRARWKKYIPEFFDLLLKPQIGIVFVAMKRNIADLPAVFSLANRLGSLHFLVTNVLPYTPEMQDEILYSRAVSDSIYTSTPLLRFLEFPKMDISPTTREAVYQALRGDHALNICRRQSRDKQQPMSFYREGGAGYSLGWRRKPMPCADARSQNVSLSIREIHKAPCSWKCLESECRSKYGTSRSISPSAVACRNSISLPASFAEDVNISNQTRKIASAVLSPLAAAACGRRESSNALNLPYVLNDSGLKGEIKYTGDNDIAGSLDGIFTLQY